MTISRKNMPLHVFIFESWWICPGISALFPGISAFFPGISAQKNRHIFTQSGVRSAQKARNPKITTIIKKWPFPAPSQEIRPKGRNLGNGHLFVSFRRSSFKHIKIDIHFFLSLLTCAFAAIHPFMCPACKWFCLFWHYKLGMSLCYAMCRFFHDFARQCRHVPVASDTSLLEPFLLTLWWMVKIRPSNFGARQKGKRNIAVARKKNSEHVDVGLHCRTIAHKRESVAASGSLEGIICIPRDLSMGAENCPWVFPRAQCYTERSAGSALLRV